MMRRRRVFGQQSRQVAAIEMAPLIDMVFILLIFFIVTTSFIRETGVEINRPESRDARAISGTFVPVAITKTGAVFVGGREIPPMGPAAEEALASALRNAAVNRVVIQADRETPTGRLLDVMDTAKRAGAKQVEVAASTRRE